ncbi:hypothetical protein LZ31DRAFT_220950 [Colletotrichum somersetense]|nr:hypothetical protein LZ31DRAFT_220950 [Colletotrichum somersetense]
MAGRAMEPPLNKKCSRTTCISPMHYKPLLRPSTTRQNPSSPLVTGPGKAGRECQEHVGDSRSSTERSWDGHLGVLSDKWWCADVLILQGRVDWAEVYMRAACDRVKYAEASDIDGEHPDRLWHTWELVQLLERKGRLEEALTLCHELVINLQTVGGYRLGPSHRINTQVLQKIETLKGTSWATNISLPTYGIHVSYSQSHSSDI